MAEKQEDLYMKSMEYSSGKLDMTLGGDASMRFMEALINFYETNGGNNFLTLDIAGQGKRYSITVEDTSKKLSPSDRLNEMQKALTDMIFAYQNKDADCPHQFETEALSKAKSLIA